MCSTTLHTFHNQYSLHSTLKFILICRRHHAKDQSTKCTIEKGKIVAFIEVKITKTCYNYSCWTAGVTSLSHWSVSPPESVIAFYEDDILPFILWSLKYSLAEESVYCTNMYKNVYRISRPLEPALNVHTRIYTCFFIIILFLSKKESPSGTTWSSFKNRYEYLCCEDLLVTVVATATLHMTVSRDFRHLYVFCFIIHSLPWFNGSISECYYFNICFAYKLKLWVVLKTVNLRQSRGTL
jgi:hypothetical protein